MSKKRTVSFKTEVSQLLDLMVHSLYSNREVFLRELVSNANDALEKLRFAALSDASLLGEDELAVEVVVDKEAGVIEVRDNGIGMSEEEVIANIGTIAKSGTKAFVEKLKESGDSNLIGQFGVGFYASFMVADEVVLETRKAGGKNESEGVRWRSKGDGKFSIEGFEKPARGTTVRLTLREDAADFLDAFALRGIIHQYSEHLSFPVKMEKVREDKDGKKADAEWEVVNAVDALWLRSTKEISDEEYKAFYKQNCGDFADPLLWLHNKVEGSLEYTTLLYLPEKAPFDLYERDRKRGLKLFVKRVFVMDNTDDLLPTWLRFVRGVIDCADLPLNVSREILQDNPNVRKIRAAIIKRVLDALDKLVEKDAEKYAEFWGQFGNVLKEGVIETQDIGDKKDRIARLLRFHSTHALDAQSVSLTDYVSRMKEGQKSIFYVCGDSVDAVKASPHLEIFKDKGVEVLLLTDRIDEWLVSHLHEFDGKKLAPINKSGLSMEELDAIAGDEGAVTEEVDCTELVKRLRRTLGDAVGDVKVSKRLRSLPSCMVTDANQMTPHMQEILKSMGQDVAKLKPILEVNPGHPLIAHINGVLEAGGDSDAAFEDWAHLLLAQARLAEGAALAEPSMFVERLNRLLLGAVGERSNIILPG